VCSKNSWSVSSTLAPKRWVSGDLRSIGVGNANTVGETIFSHHGAKRSPWRGGLPEHAWREVTKSGRVHLFRKTTMKGRSQRQFFCQVGSIRVTHFGPFVGLGFPAENGWFGGPTRDKPSYMSLTNRFDRHRETSLHFEKRLTGRAYVYRRFGSAPCSRDEEFNVRAS
jgi:hypothetical protein